MIDRRKIYEEFPNSYVDKWKVSGIFLDKVSI